MQKPISSIVSVKTRVLLIDFELQMFFCILKNKSVIFSLEEAEPVLIWAWFFCVSSEISSSFYECKTFAKFFTQFFSRWYKVWEIGKKSIFLKPSKFSHFPASFEKSETSLENFIHSQPQFSSPLRPARGSIGRYP